MWMSVPLPVTVCINVKIPQEDIIANVMKILRWILLIQRNVYVSILIQGQLSPVCATHVKNYFFKKVRLLWLFLTWYLLLLFFVSWKCMYRSTWLPTSLLSSRWTGQVFVPRGIWTKPRWHDMLRYLERYLLDCRKSLRNWFGFGFGFTTPFGWLVYLLWFWFYDSQVKTGLFKQILYSGSWSFKTWVVWEKGR